MNGAKIIITLLAIFFGFSTVAFAAEKSNKYKNQRGSTMALIWHDEGKQTGTLTGTFTTAVGRCKADVGVPLPIFGFFNGNAFTISVNLPHCNGVISMTGNVTNNGEQLHTMWVHAAQAADPTGKDWNTTSIGSDHFKEQS